MASSVPIVDLTDFKGDRGRLVSEVGAAYMEFGFCGFVNHGVPDLKEFWHVAREMGPDNPWPDIIEPNMWPQEVPGFQEKSPAL